MKRVLLTGATGFIGSHVASQVLARGCDLSVLVRRETPDVARLAAAGAAIVRGDLHHEHLPAAAVSGVDTVMHLAAATAAFSRADMFRTNVAGTAALLRACDGKGIHVIHVSSQAAVGPSGPGQASDESSTAAPLTWYGESKLASEQLVQAWAGRAGNRATILRPSVVYGPGDRALLASFRLAARGVAPVPGDGQRVFSVIYVHDLVAALFCLATRPAAPAGSELFFAAGDESVTWRQWAAGCAAALGRRVCTVRVPECLMFPLACAVEAVGRIRGKPALLSRQKWIELRQRSWRCCADKLRHLGWEPAHPLDCGLRESGRWYREHGWL